MNKLVRFDPFAEIDALQREFFGNNWLAPSKSAGLSTTDVYTTENQLVVEAHVPNFIQDDIHIEIENGSLVIQGEKHEKEEDKNKRYVLRESSTSFYRRIQLPDRADTEKIEAHLDDGILKVTVPLAPIPEPKKIAVKSSKKLAK